MKVVAVYKAMVEVYVDLGEFDTWEDAAAACAKREKPPIPPPEKVSLYLERIYQDQGDEDCLYHGHEVVGVCALCGEGIADGCGFAHCLGVNHKTRPGWVSTEHGHRIWCSEECRSKDPEDFEREEQ
jgi:hypothetical protein